MTKRHAYLLAAALATAPASAAEVGRVGLDLKGNDVLIEAFADPKVDGVTCHTSRFDRGTLDRLMAGNWFENPSNMSVSCGITGPIQVKDIDLGRDGEDVFSERASLIFKRLKVRRIYDAKNHVLIYVGYSTEVIDSSAKNTISTISLHGTGIAPLKAAR
jgi:CreA protein